MPALLIRKMPIVYQEVLRNAQKVQIPVIFIAEAVCLV